jgi:hypothetical protein
MVERWTNNDKAFGSMRSGEGEIEIQGLREGGRDIWRISGSIS